MKDRKINIDRILTIFILSLLSLLVYQFILKLNYLSKKETVDNLLVYEWEIRQANEKLDHQRWWAKLNIHENMEEKPSIKPLDEIVNLLDKNLQNASRNYVLWSKSVMIPKEGWDFPLDSLLLTKLYLQLKSNKRNSAFLNREHLRKIIQDWKGFYVDLQHRKQDLIHYLKIHGYPVKGAEYQLKNMALDVFWKDFELDENLLEKHLNALSDAAILLYFTIYYNAALRSMFQIEKLAYNISELDREMLAGRYEIFADFPDSNAVVGQPYVFEVGLHHVLTELPLKMSVNKDSLPIKNGIGHYHFTPDTLGQQQLKRYLSFVSPLNGEYNGFIHYLDYFVHP